MFPADGWDVATLGAAITSYLSNPLVTASVGIVWSFALAGRVLRLVGLIGEK
jgi:hypothetical protein